MTDFQLTAEFPPFSVVGDTGTGLWVQDTALPNYRKVLGFDTLWLHESTIDLSGRTVLKDETVFFRSSFEQYGGFGYMNWKTSVLGWEGIGEFTIISSVPLTDENLANSILTAPGFIPLNTFGPGNFDRSVIIHGRSTTQHLNTTAGSGPTNQTSFGYMVPVTDTYFSSLEPTAADTLYCYRLLALNTFQSPGANLFFLPPKRVILDCMSAEEPTLEYMMRLKRSYELANQV